jgi:type IV pilus assembly protein PilX
MNKLPPKRPHQKGTVLLVAMIMLLVMTLLGINSMRGTALEERMAGNWRDQNIALQAAEAALRDAERSLPNMRPEPRGTVADGCPTDEVCDVYEMDTDDSATFNYLLSTAPEKKEKWRDSATEYAVEIAGASAQPLFLIEARGIVRDSLTSGFGYDGAAEGWMDMYQITAEGFGQTEEVTRVLQIIYAKRYN